MGVCISIVHTHFLARIARNVGVSSGHVRVHVCALLPQCVFAHLAHTAHSHTRSLFRSWFTAAVAEVVTLDSDSDDNYKARSKAAKPDSPRAKGTDPVLDKKSPPSMYPSTSSSTLESAPPAPSQPRHLPKMRLLLVEYWVRVDLLYYSSFGLPTVKLYHISAASCQCCTWMLG